MNEVEKRLAEIRERAACYISTSACRDMEFVLNELERLQNLNRTLESMLIQERSDLQHVEAMNVMFGRMIAEARAALRADEGRIASPPGHQTRSNSMETDP